MKDLKDYIYESSKKDSEKILDCKPKTLNSLKSKILNYFKSNNGPGERKFTGSNKAYINGDDSRNLEKKYNINLSDAEEVSIWFMLGKVAQAQLYIIELNNGVILGLRENSHMYMHPGTWSIIGCDKPYQYGENFLNWLNDTYKDLGISKDTEAIFSMFGFTDEPKYQYN